MSFEEQSKYEAESASESTQRVISCLTRCFLIRTPHFVSGVLLTRARKVWEKELHECAHWLIDLIRVACGRVAAHMRQKSNSALCGAETEKIRKTKTNLKLNYSWLLLSSCVKRFSFDLLELQLKYDRGQKFYWKWNAALISILTKTCCGRFCRSKLFVCYQICCSAIDLNDTLNYVAK